MDAPSGTCRATWSMSSRMSIPPSPMQAIKAKKGDRTVLGTPSWDGPPSSGAIGYDDAPGMVVGARNDYLALSGSPCVSKTCVLLTRGGAEADLSWQIGRRPRGLPATKRKGEIVSDISMASRKR